MAHIRPWRVFRRAQDLTVVTACLIYGGATLHAFSRLPGGPEMIAERTLVWPTMLLIPSLLIPLAVPPFRRGLARYVWMSFLAGFGQNARSILGGVVLLGGAATLIYWQIG